MVQSSILSYHGDSENDKKIINEIDSEKELKPQKDIDTNNDTENK